MLRPWEVIVDDLLDVASIINDFLDTNNPMDIKWATRDLYGNITYVYRPNLAKILSIFQNDMDNFKTELYTYLKNNYPTLTKLQQDLTSLESSLKEYINEQVTNVDNKLNTLNQDLPSIIDRYNVPTIETFERNRRDLASTLVGNGVIEYGSKTSFTVPELEDVEELTQFTGFKNIINIGYRDSTTTNYPPKHNGIYHVNGVRIMLKGGPDIGTGTAFNIKLPEAPTIKFSTSNSSSIPESLKQGEIFYLDDLDREIMPDYSFDIDTLFIPYGDGSSVSVSDSIMTVSKGTTDAYGGAILKRQLLIPGVKYKVEIKVTDIDVNDTCRLLVFDSDARITYADLRFSEAGTYSVIIQPETTAAIYIQPDPGTVITDSNKYVKLDYVSIKQIEPAIIKTAYPIPINTDLYGDSLDTLLAEYQPKNSYVKSGNARVLFALSGVFKDNLVFLETWYEDVSEKDFVYPYGNVQYRGSDIDGLSGITEGTFTGADTYSLFGEWQTPGELIGKGYVWSKLSEDEKLKFANDPDNNIFKDGDRWVQVRYRIRVIEDYHYKIDNVTPLSGTYLGSLGYKYGNYHQLGVLPSNTIIRTKGKRTIDDNTGTPYIGVYARRMYTDKIDNDFYVSNGGYTGGFSETTATYPNTATMALLMFTVSRLNRGVYHPIFNPLGTALVYKDGDALHWYQVDESYISSTKDCFDPDKIAYININDNTDVQTINTILNSSLDINNYRQTGSIELQISGRPDGKFYDGIDMDMIKDLRYRAKYYPYSEILKFMHKRFVLGRLPVEEMANGFIDITGMAFASVKKSSDPQATWSTPKAGDTIYALNTNNVPWLHRTSNKTILGILIDKQNNKLYYLRMYNTTDGNLIVRPIGHMYIYDPNRPLTDNPSYITYTGNPSDYMVLIHKNFLDFPQSMPRHFRWQNNRTEIEVIGNVASIDNRVSVRITSNTTVTIYPGDYVYVDSNSNNNGSTGHYYFYVGTSTLSNIETDGTTGDANASDGHIDFSDTNLWKDLGTDGNAGSIPESWLTSQSGIQIVPADDVNRATFFYVSTLPEKYTETDVGSIESLRVKLFRRVLEGYEVVAYDTRTGTYYKMGTRFAVMGEGFASFDSYFYDGNRDYVAGMASGGNGGTSYNNYLEIVLYAYDKDGNLIDTLIGLDELPFFIFIATFKAKNRYIRPVPRYIYYKEIDDDNIIVTGDALDNDSAIDFFTEHLLQKVAITPSNNSQVPCMTYKGYTNQTQLHVNQYFNYRHESLQDVVSSVAGPYVKGIPLLRENVGTINLVYLFKEAKIGSDGKPIDDGTLELPIPGFPIDAIVDSDNNIIIRGQREIPLLFYTNENLDI